MAQMIKYTSKGEEVCLVSVVTYSEEVMAPVNYSAVLLGTEYEEIFMLLAT
jgi:hypothetical protein